MLRIAAARHFLDRQGFTGQGRLGDKQIAGLNHAQIGRDHVPCRQFDHIAHHQLIDRQFQPGAFAFRVNDALHGGGIADHRLQGVRRAGGARLLDKVEHGRDRHHQRDHACGKQIFRGIRNDRQHRQQQVERVAVAEPQMDPPRGRFLRRDFVVAVRGACFFYFGCVQPFRMTAEGAPDFVFVHRGGFQAMLRQRGGNGSACQVFGIRQRIALNQTARQVAV
ncbi:hypothetical protein D3C72_971570 [compost metagenome]